MNSRKSLYDKQEFYRKGAILKASFQGMRYQVEKWQKDNEEECFRAAIWPEPFCFEKTPEENKTYAYFPYTEEGLDDVYDWLCTQYDEKKDRWDQAGESAMIFPKHPDTLSISFSPAFSIAERSSSSDMILDVFCRKVLSIFCSFLSRTLP